jgi:hypothetical protein
MRAMLPIALLGLALMLGAYFGPRLLARLRLLFSYPAYGTSALCPHCVRPLPNPDAHVCPFCILPISGFAATDPILRVLATGAIYRQGARRLVGAGLAGFLLLAGSALVAAAAFWLSGERFGALEAVVLSTPAFAVIVRAFLARRAHSGGA